MLFIILLFIAIILIVLFYSFGVGIKTIFKLNMTGFELIIGYLSFFGLFHLLSIVPVVLKMSVHVIYYLVYPILLFILLFVIFSNRYLILKSFKTLKKRLILMIVLIISGYFLLDFIRPGDRSFYFPLIRQVVDAHSLYNLNPWTLSAGSPGFMYYFITYEAFLGSLSGLFHIDSTIFTVNVITILNLSIILHSLFYFLKYLFKTDTKTYKAFFIYLFIFMFMNSNLHAIFFPDNAFNIMINITAGKTLYLHAVIFFEWMLIDQIMRHKHKQDLLILGLLNFITPGLSASALFLQLMITIVLFVYFIIIDHREKDRFYSHMIFFTGTPLIINYLFILYAKDFYITSDLLKGLITLFFILILLMGTLLWKTPNLFLTFHKQIQRAFFIALSLISVSVLLIVIDRHAPLDTFTQFLSKQPTIFKMTYLYLYDLCLFYSLALIAFMTLYKHREPLEHRHILLDFPLMMMLLFLNPIVYPFVAEFITSFQTYHRTLYIVPIEILIVVYLMSLKSLKKEILIGFLILIPGMTIVNGMDSIFHHNLNFYYKIDQDVVSLGKTLNDSPTTYTFIGDEEIMGDLPMVTNHIKVVLTVYDMREINHYPNEDLTYIYNVINHHKGTLYQSQKFHDILIHYQITALVVYQDNSLVPDLNAAYSLNTNLCTGTIFVYTIE